MKPSRSQSKLWIILTIVFGLAFIASGYLNAIQFQRAQDNERLLNGTITDLRYELGLENKTASPSPSPSTSVSPTPTPTGTVVATPTPTPTAPAATTGVTNQPANFRQQPSAAGTLIQRLPAGTTVTITGPAAGSYWPVTYNGQPGYILVAAIR